MDKITAMTESVNIKEVLDRNLEDDEVQEVLRNGTDLREYALQIDKGIKEAEKNSVADYLRESENIGQLHHQIEECDDILARMESMLMVFQVPRYFSLSMNRSSIRSMLLVIEVPYIE